MATLVVPLGSDRLSRLGALAASSLVGGVAGLGVAIAASESAGGWLTAAVLMTLSGVANGRAAASHLYIFRLGDGIG